MSCDTLNAQSTRLNVSMGRLPEGFCPESIQAMGEAIASRLIVTPSEATSSFVTGSVAPTRNVGPWFKDCQEWWVWSDTLGAYIPLPNSQFTRMQVFDANGTWTNNFNSTSIIVEAWGGGGGGGAGGGGYAGGGGGGGGYVRSFVTVVNGQSYSVAIGSGGGAAADGTDTTFSTLIARGGKKGTTAAGAVAPGGLGGSGNGATEVTNGGTGGEGEPDQGGYGGDSPKGGQGGPVSSLSTTPGGNGIAPGGGGGGAVNPAAGGAGANGRVIIIY